MARPTNLIQMANQRPGKPSLSATESARVLSVLQRLLRERFKGNKSELARALGVSQPAVTQLLDETNLPSLKTARAVARIDGADVTSYLDEHADDPPDAGPFPSKRKAAQSARGLDLPDWAIEQMLSEPPPLGLTADPGAMFWFRRVEQLLAGPRPRTTPDAGRRVRDVGAARRSNRP